MDFETLTLPYSLVSSDSFEVTNQEISKYYKDNKEDYHVPEKRELKYVSFSITPSPADTQLTREDIFDLKERIESGEEFKTVATEYSEDTGTKDNGGDLGWFTKNQMAPKFAEAAFNAGEGEVVGPVLTRYGYHLIKVEDTKTEDGQKKVKARHILLKIKTGPETENQVESQANLFAFDANEMGFEAAADSSGYTIQQAPPLMEDTRYIRGLGYFPEASRFAFSTNSTGSISDVFKSSDNYVICKLTSINDEHYTKLVEVKEQIRAQLVQEKRLDKLEQMALDIYDQLTAASSLKSAADQNSVYQFNRYTGNTINGTSALNRKKSIKDVLVELEVDQTSKPVQSNNNYVLVKVNEREEFDKQAYQQKRPELRSQLLTTKRNQFYSSWIAALKEEADIFDNHKRFY